MELIDVLGAVVLPFLALANCVALTSSDANRPRRRRFVVYAAIWFAAILMLSASGTYSMPGGRGVVATGASILAPVLTGILAFAFSRSVRTFVSGIPLAALVGMHAGRLLGVFFLALHDAGRLPPTFAKTAGWGDIAVALAAVPLVWLILKRVPGWRPLTWAWNGLAFIDLVTAVALGIGSAPDSPLRFLFEPNPGTIARLPWAIIPGILVPTYILSHFAIFARLVAKRSATAPVLTK